jgi:ATP-dependent Lhr-like helicase
VFQGFPGERRSTRQLQASSSLFFEVFRRHDPENRLLGQAEAEVLRQELECDRLGETLARLRRARIELRALARPSPFAFPLMIERMRERLSTESLHERIARMVRDLEEAAR